MRHSVAISDIHLCEIERTDGLWMRYRQAQFSPDNDLAAMLDALRERVRGDELSLVLNGDVFDFDAPRVVNGESVFHDLPRTAEHGVPAMKAILEDHPVFVQALGRVLADGHEVVFVSGNHDVLLTLPEVRQVLLDRLEQACAASRSSSGGARRPRMRVVFRSWFHVGPDGIVFEHGHQYDGFCAHRYPMIPFGRDEREIQPTMGSLTTRNLVSRMGYFNPHVDGSYMLSAIGYLAHWARYYLFSKRTLFIAYARGAAHVLAELVRRRLPGTRSRHRQNILLASRETGAPLARVARHARLFDTPAEDRLRSVVREFWVDRVAWFGLTLVLGLVFLLAARGPLVIGAAIAPALFLTYELSIPKEPIDATWRRVQKRARRVARAHRARAVVFGHTHHPSGEWEDGVFYGNTGTWSPAYKDLECTTPVDEERPVVWLVSDGDKPLRGGLMMWKNGHFRAAEPATPRARDAASAWPTSGDHARA